MKLIALSLVLASFGAAPIQAKEEAPTGLALQQIQARDYEATMDVLFPAIVSVLQDSGYRITEADKVSGFISGVGSAKGKLTYNIFWGLGQKKNVPMVSAFVEQRGPTIGRVRLSFVMSAAKSRKSYSDETPVNDPTVYKDAFELIEKEIFVRQAMNASTPGTTPVSSAAAATVDAAAIPH